MFRKGKITLAKSVIYEHLEEFLDKIINLEYAVVEIGIGIDRPHPDLEHTKEMIARLSQLKKLLNSKGIPLQNVRIHLPLGYHFDVFDKFWHEKKRKLYDSFSVVEKFVRKADKLGFRQFDMHPPLICVQSKVNDKEFVNEYDEALNEYCKKLKALRKSIKGKLFMEFVEHESEYVHEGSGYYKKYIGTNFDVYRLILRKTGVEPLLDTSAFNSLGEFKLAKKRIEKEGFLVKAVHIQQNRLKGHHNPLPLKDFRKIIDDFAGIIVDEGLFDYQFKKGELNKRIEVGEDLSHLMLTPEKSVEWMEKYWAILKNKGKANLVFRLKEAVDKKIS